MKKTLGVLATLLVFSNAIASEGIIATQKAGNITHVKITGQAANDIQETLTRAPHGSKKEGSLFRTFVIGKNITCSTSSAAVVLSTCRFSLNEDGLMDLSKIEITTKSDAGNAAVQKTRNGVAVTLSGPVGEKLLATMKNVSSHGTMTINKDSGDIRCHQVTEFRNRIATCSFHLDAYGSASSK